ncbi:MAG: hypothetical protein O2973_09035 [Gemmatimonadetes bacterium]|nr:hypothetical protein [Gemmatimonadota bacterium]
MIAGEAPHSGTTAQAIIAKLMTAEPLPLSTLRSSSPVHVEIAVQKALAKLPADRYSSAREFADALEGKGFTLAAHTTAAHAGPAAAGSVARHPLVIGLAAIAVIATGVAAYQWSIAYGAPERTSVRFYVPLATSMVTGGVLAAGTNIAVSPDGNTIAFVAPDGAGSSSVFIRTLADAESRPLAGTDGAQEPFFSYDGQWIGFFVGGSLSKIPIGGGTPIPVAEVGSFPVGVSWSATGVIVTSVANNLIAVPDNGGPVRVLAMPDSAEGDQYFQSPIALPDGETVVFAAQPTGGVPRTRLAVLSLKTGKITRLDVLGVAPLGIAGGYLIYATLTGALFAVPFDVAKQRTTGEPVALGVNVVMRSGVIAEAALSPSGTMVLQSGSVTGQVGTVDMSGAFKPLLADAKPYGYPRYSPDGMRIAISIGAGSRSDAWVYDIAAGTSTRLTTEGTTNERIEWHPDGTRVLYRTDRGARSAFWWQPADLSTPAAPLLASLSDDFFEGVLTPDGKSIVYQLDNAGTNQADVMYRALEGDTTSKPIAASNFVEGQPRVSPDGKWVAFVTDASGIGQVVVQPFPGPGPRVQVSASGGSEPVWSRDGRKIFYRDGRRFIAATITTSPSFTVTGRTLLFADEYVFALSPHANYDVSRDGTHFLVVKNTDAAKLTVIYDWLPELRARMTGRQ